MNGNEPAFMDVDVERTRHRWERNRHVATIVTSGKHRRWSSIPRKLAGMSFESLHLVSEPVLIFIRKVEVGH